VIAKTRHCTAWPATARFGGGLTLVATGRRPGGGGKTMGARRGGELAGMGTPGLPIAMS